MKHDVEFDMAFPKSVPIEKA